MQLRLRKGLKPLLIYHLALLMGICYLLNPLQRQINTVLHEISHVLKVPNGLLSHDSTLAASTDIHPYHEHTLDTDLHSHELLDLVDSIFEGFNEKDQSDKTLLSKVKLDKHLKTYAYRLKIFFVCKTTHVFGIPDDQLLQGHFMKFTEPPQPA